jgi:hypothetical protein
MTVAEVMSAAYEADPIKMEKVAKAIFVMEHIDSDLARELKDEISYIADYSVEKTAQVNLSKASDVVTGVALGAASMAGAGLLAAVATDLYDAAKRGLTKGSNFKRIMDANPQFKGQKTEALAAFNAIHRYAPEMTADPMVGGSLMNAIMQMPDGAYNTIKDVTSIRKSLQESKHKQVNFQGPKGFGKSS